MRGNKAAHNSHMPAPRHNWSATHHFEHTERQQRSLRNATSALCRRERACLVSSLKGNGLVHARQTPCCLLASLPNSPTQHNVHNQKIPTSRRSAAGRGSSATCSPAPPSTLRSMPGKISFTKSSSNLAQHHCASCHPAAAVPRSPSSCLASLKTPCACPYAQEPRPCDTVDAATGSAAAQATCCNTQPRTSTLP